MPSPDLARQIADMDAQIADVQARIFQQQKRVENLVAKGGDAADLRSTIAAQTKALVDLQARRAELQRQARGGGCVRG